MYKALYTAGTGAGDDQRRLAMDAATAQQLSSRIPGGKGIGDILRNAPQVERDRAAYRERQREGSPAEKAIAENPEVQVKAFTAAWTAFEAAWGAAIIGPVTEALKAMTAALNGMADWARGNPGTARLLSETALGLIAVSGAIKAVSAAVEGAKASLGASLLLRAGGAGVVASVGAPLAVAGLGLYGAYQAGTDPDYANKERSRELAGAKASVQQYAPLAADPIGDGRPIQLRGPVILNGKTVGQVLADGLSGPNTGTTGFDQRTGYTGSMPAP